MHVLLLVMFNFFTDKNSPLDITVLNKSASNVVALFVDKHKQANDRVVVATRRHIGEIKWLH